MLDQVVAGDQVAGGSASKKTVSDGEWPGRWRTWKRAAGERQLAAVAQSARVTGALPPQPR